MKLALVGKWRTVMFRSAASLLGMLAALLGLIALIGPQVGLLQGAVSPLWFFAASTLASASVPLARIVKQEQLRLLTAAANPQPGVPNDPQ